MFLPCKKFEVCPVWICVAADADAVLVGALVPLDSHGPAYQTVASAVPLETIWLHDPGKKWKRVKKRVKG